MSVAEGHAIDMLRLEAQVHSAVASVDDPEYPGISIVDLGLLETIQVNQDGSAVIGLIPTFSGCPALAIIADDVVAAVQEVADVSACTVDWLSSPAWHADRVSHEARSCLERKFTVAVQIGQRSTTCPLCASKTVEQSMFGPSRCRSVHTCTGCGETVEVMRG
jgi:ring-1,2-phenylacetyl-CoA epoxidase subunit PaaD